VERAWPVSERLEVVGRQQREKGKFENRVPGDVVDFALLRVVSEEQVAGWICTANKVQAASMDGDDKICYAMLPPPTTRRRPNLLFP
jgi:hypothetical protein